jgi:hypothetical protein
LHGVSLIGVGDGCVFTPSAKTMAPLLDHGARLQNPRLHRRDAEGAEEMQSRLVFLCGPLRSLRLCGECIDP